MKVWIVCVLLCAAFTLRTATAAAIETEPVQDQLLLGEQAVEELNDTVEDKEEALKVDAAAEAAATETEPVQDQLLLGEQAVEELNDTVEDKEEALKVDAAAEVKLGYCPPGWLKYESRCFRLMRSGLSWLNAEAQCVTEGARLASVRNLGEHRFLQSFLEMSGLSQAWIGAYNFQGTWLWADTARFYYTNWYSLSSVSSYPCAYMRNTVGWSNTNCGSGYAYFCAIDLNSCSRT